MKKKLGILLICLTFILTGFSGCTEFDGEDGFFDWLSEDDSPLGGYDYCYVYGYANINVLDATGPEGHLIKIYYGNDKDIELVATYDSPSEGYLEKVYLGNVRINQTVYQAAMWVIVDGKNETDMPIQITRIIDFETASSGGSRSEYTWIENFDVLF